MSSSPTNQKSAVSPQDILVSEKSNFKASLRKSQKQRSQIEPPKSPGIIRSTTASPGRTPQRYSPRNVSPSPNRNSPSPSAYRSPSPSAYRSPAPSSPLRLCSPSSYSPVAQGYQPGPCSPRSPNTFSSYSPRSPSPHNIRTARFSSQPAHLTQTNLALLASRRKMSLASQKTKLCKKVERRTSNWLEIPG